VADQNPPGARTAAGRPTATLSPITNQTVRQWIERISARRPEPRDGTSYLPVVSINTEVLATRHPAWLLANALSEGGTVAVPGRVSAGAPPQVTAPPAVRMQPSTVTVNRASAQTIMVRGSEPSNRR